MTKEETHKKLDELFANSNSNNFINHLVRSYFPMDNVSKVLDKPEKGSFECILSKVKLISVNEALSGAENKDSLTNHLELVFKTETNELPLVSLPDTRLLGVTGNETDTFMCTELFVQFHSWVLKKFLRGDKHICRLLKDVSKGSYMNMGSKKKTSSNGATYTLGDLGILQGLKKRMENG